MRKKEIVVIHSGGMDSSICLALAIRDFGRENVLSLSFTYGQRHGNELGQAKLICQKWGVDQAVINLNCLQEITDNALISADRGIEHNSKNGSPNTLVTGRNGLMARLGAIHAEHLGAKRVSMGVIEVEECNSGYRDCSRAYMDLMQEILRIDLDEPAFEILTPLVKLTKKETLEVAHDLGVLEFLLRETITCYEGIPRYGCRRCPACELRNEGIRLFALSHPEIVLPYKP